MERLLPLRLPVPPPLLTPVTRAPTESVLPAIPIPTALRVRTITHLRRRTLPATRICSAAMASSRHWRSVMTAT